MKNSWIKQVHLNAIRRQRNHRLAEVLWQRLDIVALESGSPEVASLLMREQPRALLHSLPQTSDWVVQLHKDRFEFDDKVFHQLVREAWASRKARSFSAWKAFFENADKQRLMTIEEQAILASLDDEVTLYHGCEVRPSAS